jgi:DNA mismatch repair protein MutL
LDKTFDIAPLRKGETVNAPGIKFDPTYNPFDAQKKQSPPPPLSLREKTNRENWEKLFSRHANNQLELPQIEKQEEATQQLLHPELENNIIQHSSKQFMQLHGTYILAQISSGMLIVDQQLAHERILFEHFAELFEKKEVHPRQQQLFPQVIEFSVSDAALLNEILEEIRLTGFDVDVFGQSSFVVNGIPADLPESNIKQILEGLLENYKQSKSATGQNKNNILAKALAKNMSIKRGKILQQEEMMSLIDQLFTCHLPYASVEGKTTMTIISLDEMEKKFKL